jgi:uncharacterized protein (TIGR00730 family)
MPPYELGNEELDAQIRRLVSSAAPRGGGVQPDADLAEELIVTAIKLLRDQADRADVRLINTAAKELRYAFRVFARYRDFRKVAIFGSARTPPDDPNYSLARDLAAHLAWDQGWMVMTGAGPGIMEAANRGAGERSFGVNIRLPFEDEANQYVPPDKVVNFRYFFSRKLVFVKEAHAFVLFPGGFGTLDETLETLTLMQTGKSDLHPVVLMEAAGSGYWQEWLDFAAHTLVPQGMITEGDTDLARFTTSLAEAAEEITHFYANYHSQRYVDGRLVLRLLHAPTEGQVAELNDLFSDILVAGRIEAIAATPVEAEEGDWPHLPRLRLHFDRRSLGRLRAMIDHLNALVP